MLLLKKNNELLDHNLIHKLALCEGFDLVGIASCRPLIEHRAFLDSYLDRGYHATLGYLERNVEKRIDPTLLSDGAQTIICCAVSYNSTAWQNPHPDAPRVASYALTTDYHTSIKEMLRNLFAKLKDIYPTLEGRAFVDTAPVLEKAWAVEAGLGWIGRNSLLINPRFGSFILLGELIINMRCDKYDSPQTGSGCGECRKCLEACPTQAIVSPKVIDARRCISRLTVESIVGEVDSPTNLHGWIFGCDVCQSVCPHNQRALPYSNLRFAPLIAPEKLDREFWLTLSKERFEDIFGSSPMQRGGYSSIKDRYQK